MQHILAKAANIQLAIFDVDGVMTDGQLHFTENGESLKTFHAHDGQGIKLLQKTGVHVAIITSRKSPIINQRMETLGVTHIYQGQTNKMAAFDDLLNAFKLHPDQVAYTGDDLPDLALIRRAGLGIAVANAIPWIKQHADWQTKATGGNGAVREVCELIMRAQNTLLICNETSLTTWRDL